MPSDQNVKQSHRQANPGFEIRPGAVHHLLESTHQSQHRQHGLNQHSVVPLSSLADSQVGRTPIHFGEAFIGKDNHLIGHTVNDKLEGAPIVDVGCVAIPINDKTEVVEQQTELAADNPTLVGDTFSANLLVASPYPQAGISFPSGVD